ncbi:hypothetical protein [Pseudomonas cannabina]|uniref:hypothetical protein n=1 Tax=Pseudomonas cannabina TaxID=86840 RepID=UPI000EFF1409|nr:hypothetical protein [Pseudomonas cannabina]
MSKPEHKLPVIGANYLPKNSASDDIDERSVGEPKSYFDPKSDSAFLEHMAEHIKRFGTTAKGKTESLDKLTKHLADRQSGLGWQDAWTLRLRDMGVKNRLPRGFKAKPLSERG